MSIDSINALWEQICDYCRENNKISDVGFKTWLSDAVPVQNNDGIICLFTSNDYKRKTIDLNYKNILIEACEAVCGIPFKIEVVVREEETATKKQTSSDEDYTFNNFVVGESNKFAHAAAMAVAEKPAANVFNPLFIYGNSGVGKTHLMKAIQNSIEKKYPEKKIILLRGEQFMNELFQAFKEGTTDVFHDRFRSVDVLLIDDIHIIAGKETPQEEFFNTFNALYPEKQIVVTSDRPPKEIKTLEERIRSRFEGGQIIDIQPPDFETRVGILKNKAEQIGLEIEDDILYYIAEKIKSNIRQLEGIIKKLQAYVMINSNKLTMPLVQSYIRDVISETLPEPITVEKITEEVSRSYNVSVEDIFSRKKSQEIALARQISIYIVSQIMELSSIEIGKKFQKDHTTILYTVDKIKKLIAVNESEKKIIEDIIKNVKG